MRATLDVIIEKYFYSRAIAPRVELIDKLLGVKSSQCRLAVALNGLTLEKNQKL